MDAKTPHFESETEFIRIDGPRTDILESPCSDPFTERSDPTRAQPESDRELPDRTKQVTDNAEPRLERPVMETSLPTKALDCRDTGPDIVVI
jgi:hypothetical protein